MTMLSTNKKDSESHPTFSDDLRALIEAFAARWLMIAVIIAVFLMLGIGYIWMAKPGYISSVDIFIDPRERKLANLDVAPTGLGSSSQGADAVLVESQVAILRSRSVLGTLVEREGLASDAEFAGDASEGPLAQVRNLGKMLVYGPNVDRYNQMTPFDRALAKLERVVEVKRVGQTYVLNVSATTGSPDRSARIANAVAEIYLAEAQNAVDSSALESADSLEARLANMQQASEASQRAVEAYREEQGLLGTQGVLVDEQQLGDLTAQVVTASIATLAARAALDEIRLSGASASKSILSSDIAAQLRVQLDQAISEEKALENTFGQRHPRLVRARESRLSLQTALEAELARVTERAESDYKKASETEASLKALLTQFKERLANSNTASVKLRELEKIASRDRALYDQFATRAKQAREQISLPTTTARIISVAEPASRPSEPRVIIVLGVSLFLGLAVGFGTAWLLHVLNLNVKPRQRRLAPTATQHYANPAE